MAKANPAAEILVEAETAARKAAEQKNAELPPEAQRGFDCGFASVVVRPARGALISVARENKLGWRRDYGGGGWEFPCSGYAPTQSVDVHVAAAQAFARVLETHGYEATVTSRLD